MLQYEEVTRAGKSTNALDYEITPVFSLLLTLFLNLRLFSRAVKRELHIGTKARAFHLI